MILRFQWLRGISEDGGVPAVGVLFLPRSLPLVHSFRKYFISFLVSIIIGNPIPSFVCFYAVISFANVDVFIFCEMLQATDFTLGLRSNQNATMYS